MTNRRVTPSPFTINNPNGVIISSTHEGKIDIPNLPPAAPTVHIVPDLMSHSLLSISQLCDAWSLVEFTATTLSIGHNAMIVLLEGT